MNGKILLAGLIVLAIALSGCVVTEELQGKHKHEFDLLCDEYVGSEDVITMSGKTKKQVVIDFCVDYCGSKENYSSIGCPDKWVTCYCEQGPAETIK